MNERPDGGPDGGPILRVAHPGFATWTAPRMFGVSLWGPQTLADAQAFFDECVWAVETMPRPWDFLADNYRMRPGDHDWRGFARVFRWAVDVMPRFGGAVRQWVTVSPNTAVGWAIVGSMKLLRAPFPSARARSIDEALLLFARPDRATLGPWIEALPDHVRERTGAIARLRELLRADPSQPLALIARALGLGERSVQRLLAAHGTSLRDERARARGVPRDARDR